jgi:hypothetical protein
MPSSLARSLESQFGGDDTKKGGECQKRTALPPLLEARFFPPKAIAKESKLKPIFPGGGKIPPPKVLFFHWGLYILGGVKKAKI